MKFRITRRTRIALALAGTLLAAPLLAADVPKNLGYGLDALVEDSLTLQANPNAPTPYGGYTTEMARGYAADAIMDAATGRVLVDVVLTGKFSAAAMQSRLESKIGSLTVQAVDAAYRHTGIIEGYIAVADVPALANTEGVHSVFLALQPEHGAVQPQPSAVPGDVLNKLGTAFDQGVTQHRVDRINQYYNPNAIVNYDGAGISVAVISDSFNSRTAAPTVATDVANYDLPGAASNPLNTTPVFVYRDIPVGGGGTDEGRGMAQIVYKMAPRAKVAFFSGSYGEVQFANDIRALAAGVTVGGVSFKADVMTDDLSYGGEPYFGETIIGNAIDDATSHGVSYFSSAGNNIGINAYESPLRIVADASAGGTLLTAAAGNTALAGTNINLAGVPYNLYQGGFHNFNPNAGQLDVAQLVNMPSGSPGATEMQWDDPYDQRAPQPANPPVFFAHGISSGGASLTYDAGSTPALPMFNAGTRYVIKETATWGTFDGEVQIYDSSNNLLVDQDTVVDEVVYFDPPATDQYKIVVLPCCGTSGEFDLNVIIPLYAANGNTNATFDGGSTPALPTFTAGTTYTIEETAFSGTMDGVVTIRDPSNNVIVTQDTGTDEVVTFTAPTSGQYSIQVAPFSTTSGNFHLVVYQSLPPTGVTTDLNLLVFDTNGNYLSTKSLVTDNLANNRPVELGSSSKVSAPAGQNQLQFVISRANIPTAPQLPTRVRWSTRGNGAANIGPAEYFTYNATTTKGHASANGCNGTAAYSVFRANVQEPFTSPGPATIYFDKDANRLATPDVRQVPRVAAADGANSTWSAVSDSASDPDTNPNFSGTSAAAPHAAAIAALVLQAHGGPGSVTPAQMRTILQTNVFPHDLDPAFASGSAVTSDGGTVTITINSDNDSNLATGMNDPNSFQVAYSGPGSIASLTFNPQGTANTAGRPTSGTSGVQDGVPGTVSYFENDFPGMMFRPTTAIQASPFVIPARGFTLGNLNGLSAADITQPLNVSPYTGFSNPAPAPASATDFWTMTVGFPTGNFTNGKSMSFTVGRGAQRSSAVTAPGTTLSALADLFGGGVMIPSGMTILDGMTFSGTTTSGGTFSGVIKNNIGYGWSQVDGFGFIDAAAATGAGTTVLVAGGSATPNTTGVGFTTKLTVNVTPGASPTSTGLYVSADLESIGGAPAQKFYDDGTHGDLTAGDNVFTFDATVAAGTAIGGKTFPVVISDVQGRGGKTLIAFNVSPYTTAPSGTGAAAPSSVAPTGSTLLTVTTTAGSNPTSSGMAVVADLSSIGGSASQVFYDDGTHGDVTAGDRKFSFSAVVPLATTAGTKTLPVTITDAQYRSASASISLTVLAPTAPTASGSASPSSVAPSASTNLTVNVVGGTNPASTGLTVTGNLSAIGGSATQAFADQGGGTFTYAAGVPLGTAAGTYSLPVSVSDAQGRSGSATISVTVLSEGALAASGVASPSSVAGSGSSTLTVTVTPGTNPDSTGIAVSANLSAIGGSAAQAFTDNNDGTFSYGASVPLGTTPGSYSLPVSVTDAQGRSASANISLTVVAEGALAASGVAGTSPVDVTGSTLLTVTVTKGTNPDSTGVNVSADLSNIGGSAAQALTDNNDGTFSYNATVAFGTTAGSKSLPVTVTDAQGRSASTTVALTVNASTAPSATGSATPNAAVIGGSSVLAVAVTGGTHPASATASVTADLTGIGGSAAQALTDNGGGNYSFNAVVGNTATSGPHVLPVTVTDGLGRTASASIAFNVLAGGTLVATGSATPSSVAQGGSTGLNVSVTPGTNPASSGLAVTADLSSIGGSASQALTDNGGGNFTFTANVPFPTTAGTKSLPVTFSDAQGRSGSTNIVLTVLPTGVLSGSGIAAPATVAPTGSTTLTVTVNAGTDPASTGIAVKANLSSIGGSATQAFTDNGDGTFSFNANVPLATVPGTKSLPVTITDTQGRTAAANISLTVLTPTALSATASASPNSGIAGTASTFTVNVTAGTNPASTGVSVTADLTDFGGTATQAFTLNGGAYTFNAVVQNSAAPGVHVIPIAISDAQGRTASASIAFNVPAPGALSGSGVAVPASVARAGSATLLVSVIPGTSPASTGIAVTVDLSSIGGSATQTFVDDGTNGDQTAGDHVFTFAASIPSNASVGAKLLPATITDGQGRSGSATIQLTIVAGNEVIFQNGFDP